MSGRSVRKGRPEKPASALVGTRKVAESKRGGNAVVAARDVGQFGLRLLLARSLPGTLELRM
jgi:hypothetical protein